MCRFFDPAMVGTTQNLLNNKYHSINTCTRETDGRTDCDVMPGNIEKKNEEKNNRLFNSSSFST